MFYTKEEDGYHFLPSMAAKCNTPMPYWRYYEAQDCWELERVYTNNNRVLVATNLHVSPDSILFRLLDGMYRVPIEKPKTSAVGVKTPCPIRCVMWSEELDGMSIMILLARYPKMSYKEIMMVIENEGGSVDGQGIIHKA